MHQNKLDYKDYNHPEQVSKQVCSSHMHDFNPKTYCLYIPSKNVGFSWIWDVKT